MIRFQLRRNRIQLPVWIVVLALFWSMSASAIASEFGDTDAERGKLLATVMVNPTILALRGLPDGQSAGALVFFQIFGFLAVLAALMNTFLATRGLRADEERGRLELVGSTPVSRSAALRSVLVVGVGADLLVVLASWGVMAALGFDTVGALLAGLALGGVGLAFLGIGVLVSQLMPTSRSANTVGVALAGAAYLLRALGDALSDGDVRTGVSAVGWPSWLSPIGWAQQVSPFRRQDPEPLMLLLGFAVLTAGIAILLQRSRDLGSSLVPERAGRATAPGWLRGCVSLLWRLTGPALIGWVVVGALFGAIAGSLSDALEDAVGDSTAGVEGVLSSLAGGDAGSLVDTFVVAIMAMAGLVAVAAGLQTLLRMRGDEADGRAELLLAGPLSRVRWLLGSLLMAVLAAVAICVVSGLVAGLSFLAAGKDGDRVGSSLAAGVAQLPMVLCFLGIAALALAVLPRAATAIAWAALAVGYLLGPLGGILQLDQWARDLSPFEHTPQVPGADPDWGPAMIVLAVGVVLAAVATAAMSRRQVTT